MNFSAAGPESGYAQHQPSQPPRSTTRAGNTSASAGAGRPHEDSALTEQGLETLFAAFGETDTSCAAPASQCQMDSAAGGKSEPPVSTASLLNGPTAGYACKAPPGAVVSTNSNAAAGRPMPAMDDNDMALLSLLSKSIAASGAGSGSGCMNFAGQHQLQQPQAQAQTDERTFQWNPPMTNNVAGMSVNPCLAGPMSVDPAACHANAGCAADPSAMASIDQGSAPRFTVEEERRELATLSIDEIISVEKDLRGVQANFGGMSLSSSGLTPRTTLQQQPEVVGESSSLPPQPTKKKRGRVAQAPSSSSFSSSSSKNKKKGDQPPPPDDAVEATDADILLLDTELNKIDPSLKGAYLQACLQCPAEVNSRDRKAAFLEREDLDASRAALRLVAYWQLRLSTFGSDRAFLPMTVDGAIRDDVADMIRHCVIHVLPYTDTSGRAILFYQPSKRNLGQFPLEREGRALFYLFDSLTHDPTIRRAGFVGVADYRNVSRSQISTKQQRHMKALFEVMPIRIRSCHICHPSAVMSYAYPVLKYILGRNVRLRTRLHSGSERDVLRELASCCLPRECLPCELGGEVSLDFAQWVANRSIVETSMALDEESMKHATPSDGTKDSNRAIVDNMSTSNASSPSENRVIKSTLENNASVLLTGDEARRAVIDKFTDELMAIGEAVGLRKPPADTSHWGDSPGHMSSVG